MARWSRSRLRNFGIGAVALVGGSLLVIPAVSDAGDKPAVQPVVARPASSAAPDRIAVTPGKKGHSAFQFQPASGDRKAPYGFVTAGGQVRAQLLGGSKRPAVRAATGAPQRAARADAATSYPTTLTVDTENWSAWTKMMSLWNTDTWTYVPVANPQDSVSATASLPPGHYLATAMYGIYGLDSYLLSKAFTVSTKAQTVHLAETSAKEIGFKVDDSTARLDMSAVWLSLPTTTADVVGFAGGVPGTRTYATPVSVAGTTLRVHEARSKAGSTGLEPTPFRYDLVKSWPSPAPANLVDSVTTASLAKTSISVRAQGTTADGSLATVPVTTDWTGVYLSTGIRFPATVTEYVTPGVTMSRLVDYAYSMQHLKLSDRNLPAGVSPAETVGAGPLVPSRREYNDDSRREQNQLQILENMTLGDSAGNRGADASDTASTTLSSGGQVLKTSNTASLVADVPAAQQTYQLTQTNTRKAGWSQLSTTIRSEWTCCGRWPARPPRATRPQAAPRSPA